VEEQRVSLVIDFVAPHEAWKRVGHGYRATVRIIVDRTNSPVKMPIGALVRSAGK
jgi:HlyD family secretion protein